MPMLRVPILTPRLSSLWLRFVTDADRDLARELVLGLTEDVYPETLATGSSPDTRLPCPLKRPHEAR